MHSWAKGLSREVGKHGITGLHPASGAHQRQILRNPRLSTPAVFEHEIPVGEYGHVSPICLRFLAAQGALRTGAVISGGRVAEIPAPGIPEVMNMFFRWRFTSACTPTQFVSWRDMGSFHIGGREAVLSGKPVKEVGSPWRHVSAKVDLNGTYLVESMYVQYFRLPTGTAALLLDVARRRPDCHHHEPSPTAAGLAELVPEKGLGRLQLDAVERGRAGGMYPDILKGEPVFLTTANPWDRFRIGPGPGSYDQRNQCRNPVPRRELRQLRQQSALRWIITDEVPSSPRIPRWWTRSVPASSCSTRRPGSSPHAAGADRGGTGRPRRPAAANS
jgi:hypothetical protein